LAADAVEALAASSVEGHHDLATTVSTFDRSEHHPLNITFRLIFLNAPPTEPHPLELAYLVSNVELLHIVSLLHDLTNELVATDKIGRTFEVSAIKVQVAAAESCR
jgi:hypothetical protein